MQIEEKKSGLKEILESGKEYYEIRLESIGGLGANLCGKMLGELGLKYLDVNSSNFSSYGSEKTGTPVKGFVRYCRKEKEIRLHSPVTEPDLLVVFHQALLKDSSVLSGCSPDTKIIIAMDAEQEQDSGFGHLDAKKTEVQKGSADKEVEKCAKISGQIYALPAQKIAMETHSRINVVMLGAVLKVMGMESPKAGEKICEDILGKKYPASLESNLEGLKRGYEGIREISVAKEKEDITEQGIIEQASNKKGKEDFTDQGMMETEQPKWGYLTAPIGGINPDLGNTVISDLSPSRQGYIPLFIKERCINCGLCFSACPDMVFQFAKGEYKGRKMMINQGLDYYHCKGCLRCVDVCPVNALVRGEEAGNEKKEHFMPNQELLRMPKYYEKSGADGYITSESYLTEKRMEGGEV